MARRKRNTFFRRKGMFSPGTRGRKILLWVLAIIALLTLLLIIGFYQLLSWLQGDSFRKQLESTLGNKAQATELSIPHNLGLEGDVISLPAFRLSRNDALNLVSADTIKATIDRRQLYSRHLLVKKLTVEDATLRIKADSADAELPAIVESDKGFLSRFAPESAELQMFECADTDTEFTLNGATYSIAGCSVKAAPIRRGASDWQLTIENGRVNTPLSYLQSCSIKSATLLYTPKSTSLSECRFMLTPGELRAKGSYQNKTGQWYLDLKANKANVARLLNEDWKKRLTGELYGELKLVGTKGNIREAGGNISLRQGMLEGLPVLSSLSWDNTRPYRSLPLEKAECRVSYPFTQQQHNIRNAWLFDNIDMRAANGLLRVKGHVIIAPDHSLRGTLTVGLPEHIADKLSAVHKEAADQLFNASGDAGFRWLNINLSGTLDAPQEDLTARISAIMTSNLTGAAINAADKAGKTISDVIGGLLGGAAATGAADAAEDTEADAPTDTPAPRPDRTPSAVDVLDFIF
ncbi:MAG: hypothetical protein II295_06070 [Akkermansia sp.]|nr:hypothetical protein [Akkermansia sp.]